MLSRFGRIGGIAVVMGLLIVGLLHLTGCGPGDEATAPQNVRQGTVPISYADIHWTTAAAAAPTASGSAGTVVYPDYPDPKLTPGAVRSTDLATIEATESVTEQARPGTAVKRAIFTEYGIPWSIHAQFEVDHFESIEIGGSNDRANLWPEKWNLDKGGVDVGAHTKDRLEDRLGQLIREHPPALSPAQAQAVIAGNWEAGYSRYVGLLPAYK